jgi:hypothetical protein
MLVFSYSSGVPKSHNISKWIGGSKVKRWNDFISSQPTNVSKLWAFFIA